MVAHCQKEQVQTAQSLIQSSGHPKLFNFALITLSKEPTNQPETSILPRSLTY